MKEVGDATEPKNKGTAPSLHARGQAPRPRSLRRPRCGCPAGHGRRFFPVPAASRYPQNTQLVPGKTQNVITNLPLSLSTIVIPSKVQRFVF
jgi:hypothetical protein